MPSQIRSAMIVTAFGWTACAAFKQTWLSRGAQNQLGRAMWRTARQMSEFCDMGLLPFGTSEILLPGQERYLHLYEARFLALFEHAVSACDERVVLAFFLGNNLLTTATLAQIERFEKLEVGVGATVRGLSRCTLENVQADSLDKPFIVVNATTLRDAADDPEAASRVFELFDQVAELATRNGILTDGQTREISVDPRAVLIPGTPTSDTALAGSLQDVSSPTEPSLISATELQSFLALRGASPEIKLKALVSQDQTNRWLLAETDLRRQRDELAAKAAIKSLNLQWTTVDAAGTNSSKV